MPADDQGKRLRYGAENGGCRADRCRTDPTDQRFQRLYLTDAGRKLIARMLPENHCARCGQFLAGLTHEQQKTFHELMSRLDQNLDAMDG